MTSRHQREYDSGWAVTVKVKKEARDDGGNEREYFITLLLVNQRGEEKEKLGPSQLLLK